MGAADSTLHPGRDFARAAPAHERTDRGHQTLAALSTNGVHQRVSGTGHYIQKDQPQVVIDAVEEVVAEAIAATGGD